MSRFDDYTITENKGCIAMKPKVEIVSFGQKFGIEPADMIFDVTHLPNPYVKRELRDRYGWEKPVMDFIKFRDSILWEKTVNEIYTSIVTKLLDGKHLKVAIGCIGGRHRSVAVTSAIETKLAPMREIFLIIRNRDCYKVESLKGEK